MTELKHAEVIYHMAKHGFESVEGRADAYSSWKNATINANPPSFPSWEWRIKPATITYTVTVPEPLRVMPTDGQTYWVIGCDGADQIDWDGTDFEIKLFDLGNIWDTKAKAQAAFDALFSPLRKNT
jgi:hypothetical protein